MNVACLDGVVGVEDVVEIVEAVAVADGQGFVDDGDDESCAPSDDLPGVKARPWEPRWCRHYISVSRGKMDYYSGVAGVVHVWFDH